MGWDAFGLPAENYAIKMGVHPRVTDRAQHRQLPPADGPDRPVLRLVARGHDCFPDYYRWTQWFFLLLYERGLAYRATGQQWWCPTDKTILANEQVENGRCWRCGTLVTKKDLEQWYFRITDYADRLLDDLEPSTGPSTSRSCRATGSAAARAPRSTSACRAATTCSRSSPRGPTRCSAPPSWCWRRSIRWWTSSPRRSKRAAVDAYKDEARAAGARSSALQHGQGEDRRLHRRATPSTR